MERRREGGLGGGGKEELRVTVNPIFIERDTNDNQRPPCNALFT